METNQKKNELLKSRVALITGAGQGLGKSHALYLAQYGAQIVINDLEQNEALALKTKEEIENLGASALLTLGSVADISQCENFIKETLNQFGKIDILVNNAGILRDASFKKQELKDWQEVLEVHLTGSRNIVKAAWPALCEQNYGRIVFTSSASGIYGNFGQSNYASAKMALIGFMKSLCLEGKKNNILLNSIAPIARTAMTEQLFPNELLEQIRPEWVSPLVAYFASETCQLSGEIWAVGAGKIKRILLGENLGRHWEQLQDLDPYSIHENLETLLKIQDLEFPQNLNEACQKLIF